MQQASSPEKSTTSGLQRFAGVFDLLCQSESLCQCHGFHGFGSTCGSCGACLVDPDVTLDEVSASAGYVFHRRGSPRGMLAATLDLPEKLREPVRQLILELQDRSTVSITVDCREASQAACVQLLENNGNQRSFLASFPWLHLSTAEFSVLIFEDAKFRVSRRFQALTGQAEEQTRAVLQQDFDREIWHRARVIKKSGTEGSQLSLTQLSADSRAGLLERVRQLFRGELPDLEFSDIEQPPEIPKTLVSANWNWLKIRRFMTMFAVVAVIGSWLGFGLMPELLKDRRTKRELRQLNQRCDKKTFIKLLDLAATPEQLEPYLRSPSWQARNNATYLVYYGKMLPRDWVWRELDLALNDSNRTVRLTAIDLLSQGLIGQGIIIRHCEQADDNELTDLLRALNREQVCIREAWRKFQLDSRYQSGHTDLVFELDLSYYFSHGPLETVDHIRKKLKSRQTEPLRSSARLILRRIALGDLQSPGYQNVHFRVVAQSQSLARKLLSDLDDRH